MLIMMYLSLLMIFLYLYTEILNAKKKLYADLARQVNSNKIEIDRTRERLESLRMEREDNGKQSYLPSNWESGDGELCI